MVKLKVILIIIIIITIIIIIIKNRPHKSFDKIICGFQRREICSLYRASNPVSSVAQPLASLVYGHNEIVPAVTCLRIARSNSAF
jgi:hypothetical protein